MQQQKRPLLAFSVLARSPKIQLTKTSSQQFQCEECPFQSPRFTVSLSRSISAAPHRRALRCPSFQGEFSLLCPLCFSDWLSLPTPCCPAFVCWALGEADATASVQNRAPIAGFKERLQGSAGRLLSLPALIILETEPPVLRGKQLERLCEPRQSRVSKSSLS